MVEKSISFDKKLSEKLSSYAGQKNTFFVFLSHKSESLGEGISQILHLPLMYFPVVKIPPPGEENYAIGALAFGDGEYISETDTHLSGGDCQYIRTEKEKKKEILSDLSKKENVISSSQIQEKVLIIVTEGIVTGASVLAAINSAKKQGVQKVVVASPISSQHGYDRVKKEVDEIYILEIPEVFQSIEYFYKNYSNTSEERTPKT